MIHTNTMRKAAGASNTNGLHTETNDLNFRTVGAIDQAPDGNVIATQIARLAMASHHVSKLATGHLVSRRVKTKLVPVLRNFSKTAGADKMNACTQSRPYGIIRSGARNTKDVAGNLSENEVFSRPDTSVYGLDGRIGNDRRMATSMFLTSSPPVARRKASSGCKSHVGATAMTTARPRGNKPATTTHDARQRDLIADTLALALLHVRQGSIADIHRATGRAIRATSMLKQACSDLAQAELLETMLGINHANADQLVQSSLPPSKRRPA